MSAPNSTNKKQRSFKCSVCQRPCRYFYYGVKCCEDFGKCKRCRLNLCITVGMNPRGVCVTKFCGQQIKEFVKRIRQQQNDHDDLEQCKEQKETSSTSLAAGGMDLATLKNTETSLAAGGMDLATLKNTETSSTSLAAGGMDLATLKNTAVKETNASSKWDNINSSLAQKNFVDFILLKNLLKIEQKVCRIRNSKTNIPDFYFDQCVSFEKIFASNFNLLENSTKFSTKVSSPPQKLFYEIISQKGPFCFRPPYLAMDLLFVFEIGKTFPFFKRLNISDRIALCSNIAAPLLVLSNGFYSVQQNCETFNTPCGLMPMQLMQISYYQNDTTMMNLADRVLCKSIELFIRLKVKTDEFVLLRAIIYAHMVTPGLSDQAQKMLYTEAEKFSSVLMKILQTNYGPEAGARRYMELMMLIEFVFNSGAKHRQMLTYLSCVLDPNFDLVMPPVLAKVCTKGPVELRQLFPL